MNRDRLVGECYWQPIDENWVLAAEALNFESLFIKVEDDQRVLSRNLFKMTEVYINMPDYLDSTLLLFVINR